MPPITSRRPGARATTMSARGSKSVRSSGAGCPSSAPSVSTNALTPGVLVVDVGRGAQLGRLLLGGGVAQKVPAADLGAGEVLQEVRPAERRVELDVEVETRIIPAVGRRLMQRHHVGERYLPEVVELDE